MKITFLAPHVKIAGGTRAFLTYADLLAKRNHEVTVVVPIKNTVKRIIGNIFAHKPAWFEDFKAKIKWVPAYDEKFIPSADIIVATAWQTAGPVDSYSDTKGKKFYLIQHNESLYHGKAETVDATYRLPLKKIVISSWLKEIMKEKFNADSNLIVTPVDFNIFQFKPEARGGKPIRILMLDHDTKWKGTQEGAKIFNFVKNKFPGIKLVLFGVRKSGVAGDEYHFNPPQDELARIYSSCHIYLCPSEYEGLGMPSMEAMACKCALVTYDNGGSRDYAMPGKTAFVAKHGDSNDLIIQLESAVSNTALCEKIAQNGHEFIKNNFSWQNAAEKMENIFRNTKE